MAFNDNMGFHAANLTDEQYENYIHTYSDDSTRGTCISIHDAAKHGIYVDPVLGKRSSVHDANFAFLTTTLSKLDPTKHEPLYWTTYRKDFPIEVGGGFVDYIETYTIDWAGLVNSSRNIMGNSTNYIPRVNAGFNQIHLPVFTYGVAYDLRFIDLEKMKKIKLSESINKIYNEAVMAGWDIFVDTIAYLGNESAGATGLFNSDKVEVNTITTSNATSQGFEGLTDAQVVAFFNGIFDHYLSNSNNNLKILPDTILVPTFVAKDLSSRYSELYVDTLRGFLKRHNMAVDESDEQIKSITIEGRQLLNTLGTGGIGRIVAYKKDKTFLKLHIPYPVQMYITLPNVERAAYTTIFLGQVAAPEMVYETGDGSLGTVSYFDFVRPA